MRQLVMESERVRKNAAAAAGSLSEGQKEACRSFCTVLALVLDMSCLVELPPLLWLLDGDKLQSCWSAQWLRMLLSDCQDMTTPVLGHSHRCAGSICSCLELGTCCISQQPNSFNVGKAAAAAFTEGSRLVARSASAASVSAAADGDADRKSAGLPVSFRCIQISGKPVNHKASKNFNRTTALPSAATAVIWASQSRMQ